MTLREQLLSELREQNEIAQGKIKDLEESIRAESFAMSTVTGGALSGVARSAGQSRIQAAASEQGRIEAKNAWIREMLSKYK